MKPSRIWKVSELLTDCTRDKGQSRVGPRDVSSGRLWGWGLGIVNQADEFLLVLYGRAAVSVPLFSVQFSHTRTP